MTISTDKYKMGHETYKWEGKTWIVNWETNKKSIIGIERHRGDGLEYGCADLNDGGNLRSDLNEVTEIEELYSWAEYLRTNAELKEEGLY